MTIYYVNGTTGSDQNAGTGTGTAKKTIQAGVNLATAAGDVVEIAGGDYYEVINIGGSGASGNPITVRPASGATVNITGSWNHTTLPTYGVTACLPAGDMDTALVLISGDYVTFEGLNVIDSAARGITVTGTNVTITGGLVRWCLMAAIIGYGADGLTVDGVEVDRASRLKKFYGKYWIEWGRNNNIINGWPHVVSPVFCSGATIANCTVHDSGGEGIDVYRCENVTIENCTAYNNAAVQIYSNWSGSGSVIRNNVCYLTSSYEYGGTPSGIEIRDEPEIEEKRLPNFGLSSGVKIYNNLVVHCYPNGIEIAKSANLDKYIIANNTVVARSGYNAISLASLVTTSASPRVRRNTTIYNNIFYGPNIISSSSGITWRNNIWYPGSVPGNADGNGQIAANPALVDPSMIPGATIDSADYKLTASSPAINAALPLDGIDDDLFGALRDSSPDIGCHEYGGIASPTVTASFTVSTTTPAAGESVTLTDTSTITSGAIDEWLWQVSLDNGVTKATIATTQNTSYTLPNVGSYLILLTATDTDTASSSTARKTLTVGTPITDPEDTGIGDVDTDTDAFSCAGNLLTNPSFDSSTSPWAATNLIIARVADPTDSANNVLKAHTVTSFPAEFRQSGFAITSGVVYTLSFDSWAGESIPVDVHIIDHAGGWYLADPISLTLTTTKTRYTYSVTATGSSANARLRSRLLLNKTTYWDNICLKEYGEVAASFTVLDSTPSIGDTVTLTDTSTGDPYAWSWRVNGEIISTSAGPVTWTVPDEGIYTVTLTVAGGDNTDTATETVSVEEWRDYSQRGLHRGLRRGMP